MKSKVIMCVYMGVMIAGERVGVLNVGKHCIKIGQRFDGSVLPETSLKAFLDKGVVCYHDDKNAVEDGDFSEVQEDAFLSHLSDDKKVEYENFVIIFDGLKENLESKLEELNFESVQAFSEFYNSESDNFDAFLKTMKADEQVIVDLINKHLDNSEEYKISLGSRTEKLEELSSDLTAADSKHKKLKSEFEALAEDKQTDSKSKKLQKASDLVESLSSQVKTLEIEKVTLEEQISNSDGLASSATVERDEFCSENAPIITDRSNKLDQLKTSYHGLIACHESYEKAKSALESFSKTEG